MAAAAQRVKERQFSKQEDWRFILFLNYSSSLLKRLDKIYRLLGSTLDTPEERLYLRLCLELLQRTNREAL